MKNNIITIILAFFCIGCNAQLDLFCSRDYLAVDSMNRAWYPFQIVDTLRFPDNAQFIIVNPSLSPVNLVTSEENTYRRLANQEDHLSKESYYYWDSLAKQENDYANNMNMAIWIQNNSDDTIVFPNQDGSLIAILEALDLSNKWKPIEYWWYSWCGNSYLNLFLPPNNSLQVGINNIRGERDTKMRIRIRGNDTIYISNEFIGKVSDENFILPDRALQIIEEEKYRISFLDSIKHDLLKDEYEFSGFVEDK